jgi:hypothetical protein
MKTGICFAFIFAILMVTLPGMADNTIPTSKKDNWVLLGTQAVDYLIDRDEVEIDPNSGPYSELKFTVKNGPINMHKCTLHFMDGTTKDVDFSDEVKSKTERIIDFNGSNQQLDKVTFWYDTKNQSPTKATFEVWGKK